MTGPDENATLAEPLLRPSEDHFERDEFCDATATHGEDESDESTETESLNEVKRKNTRKLLYTSHFLSTWNSRLFEFGAFLFLANIYPQTLLPASLYALCRNASAAIAAPWIGNYIDRADRLVVVRISIVGQRLAVAASCCALFALLRFEQLRDEASHAFLALLTVLACAEKVSAVLNTISVERDFVVVLAAGDEAQLSLLNSRMRRIDLFCKLIGPLVISLIDGFSTTLAVAITGGMTILSVVFEYWSIARVYNRVPALQAPKSAITETPPDLEHTLRRSIRRSLKGILLYVNHPAFLPSLSLALLYMTVLSFSGQMITYLLTLGLSSGVIGALRGISAAVEMSATWLAPKVTHHIGSERAGIWFLNWQILCVAVAGLFFWIDVPSNVAAVGAVTAVIASRVGLWGFDLSAQTIVQEEVETDRRGVFSSQEFALQNTFEMLAFASTIIFPKPEQFKYPATASVAATALAGVLYALFLRGRRGHLLHLSNCIDPKGQRKDHDHWYMLATRRGSRE